MDGLSAASGVFAVISLAVELPTAIQNLVEFCRTIKDAPDDVRSLMDELNMFAVALKQIHRPGRVQQFDAIVNLAVYQCNNELLKLRSALSGVVDDLSSPSSRKRGLGALKMAMKKPHIEAMRSSLEKVKTTLMLVKDSSFQSSAELHFQRQQQLLLEIMKAIEGSSRNAMEHGPGRYGDENAAQSELRIAVSCNEVSDTKKAPHAYSTKEISRYTGDWNLKTSTPFGEIQEGIIRTTNERADSSNRRNLVDYQRAWRVYPSGLLRFLGVRYGAMIESSTSGWQYVIKPFNAVPEDAPIFDFCRKGDLEGVRALLKLGQGSLRDRDPHGRTPLWIASQSLQYDVAEFLLREGADIHAGDWVQKSPRPPLLAIQDNIDPDYEKKSSFISLFERYHPGDHDESTMYLLIIRLVLFYRPARFPRLGIQYRRESGLKLTKQIVQDYFPHDGELFTRIVFLMLDFDLSGDPLHWALRNVKSPIAPPSSRTDPRAIHTALRKRLPVIDPISVKLIIEKSDGLHHRWYPTYEVSGVYNSFTPTTLALYHPATFIAWRLILQECKYSLETFVKQELVDSPLADDGWTVDTLLRLFMSDIVAEPEAQSPACGRCGSDGYNPPVHLPWRRYLRAVRNGHRGPFNQRCEANNLDTSAHASWEVVCSTYCRGRFCVAGLYENSLTDEEVPYGPDIPVYVSKEERELLEAKAADIAIAECPSKKMPGAFVE